MKRIPGLPLIVALTLSLPLASAFAAELVVIKSTAQAYQPGQQVAAGAKIALGKGETLTLLSQSGKPISFKGPFDGVAADSGGGDANLLKRISVFMREQKAGGAKLGATRDGGGPTSGEIWAINAEKSGTYCVADGKTANFWREGKSGKGSASVKEVARNKRGDLRWKAGEPLTAWPDGVPLKDGGEYLVQMQGAFTASRLTVHLVPGGLDGPVREAAYMIDKGCREQAQLLLESLG
ncbi:hypothetical protein [Oceanibacterium hippocampi]|uniref:Uncharacterized protein n=1 Tax=Oceanibacterium hippocampi TaxID=745714 RepID=A0A1Y5TYR8_9PROT|nr:hypothetical protein [Oceanibacterium hippocampi]SLN77158.1 hypothetical protein OCH7691_04310 [Oceanibacterium hippocampi]